MKNYKRNILTYSSFLLLTACNGQTTSDLMGTLDNYKEITHEKYLYKLAVPRETDDTFFTKKYDSYTNEIVFNISNGSAHLYHSALSCAPEVTGIGDENVLDDREAVSIWGKVNVGNKSWDPPYPDALCQYVKPMDCTSEEYWGGGCQDDIGIYAFCSEKVGDPASAADDKRVLICISQQTDDPKMAEEIFKTFRWIDQEVRPQKKDEDVSPSFG